MPPNGATLHPAKILEKRKKRMLYFEKERDQVYAEKSKVKNAKVK
jgi:hypothetical protein